MAKPPCRIVVGHQQGLVRALLRNIVSDAVNAEVMNAEIVREACSAIELLESLINSGADLVLIDISLLAMRGRTTITQIRDLLPNVKILVISKSKPLVSRAVSGLVDGCFSIEHTAEELRAAIKGLRQES